MVLGDIKELFILKHDIIILNLQEKFFEITLFSASVRNLMLNDRSNTFGYQRVVNRR